MSKGKYVAVAVGIVIAAVTLIGCIVLLLHKRNPAVPVEETATVAVTGSVVEETSAVVEETFSDVPITPTREDELFTENLSSYVGKVIVSTYMDDNYLAEALSALSGVMSENTAVYLYTVSFDRDTGDATLSYYYYNGEFGSADVELPEVVEETNYELVYEEYQGQITVMK